MTAPLDRGLDAVAPAADWPPHRLALLARTYHPNGIYDRVYRLSRSHHPIWSELPATVRVAVLMHEAARIAAEAVGDGEGTS